MKFHDASPASAIESTIRGHGARVTPARVRVLGLLQSAPGPLSHGDIEKLLNKEERPGMDRVTLYRVLDWLAESGLAHKAADGRGVFCFTLAEPGGAHKQHVHFRCTECGNIICLDMAQPSRPELPAGFRLTSAEMDIRGECADCTQNHSSLDRRDIAAGVVR